VIGTAQLAFSHTNVNAEIVAEINEKAIRLKNYIVGSFAFLLKITLCRDGENKPKNLTLITTDLL
jgi:hypothetical protein